MEAKPRVEEQRFEFLLHINGKIICQRYFHIKGFNEKSVNSFELHNMAFECVETIKRDMKNKTREYLWKYYQPYKERVEVEGDDVNKRSIYEKIDNFQFEVRVDKKTIVKREFSGNPYPPKVRYQVDIKDIIHDIIDTVRYYLTLDKYIYKFEDSEAVVEF